MTPVPVAFVTHFDVIFIVPKRIFFVQISYPSIVARIAATPVHLSTALWATFLVKFYFVVHVSSQTNCRPTVELSGWRFRSLAYCQAAEASRLQPVVSPRALRATSDQNHAP
jgi:hypothetical protein